MSNIAGVEMGTLDINNIAGGSSWFEGELKELRESYGSGKTKSYKWRKSQLKGLLTLLNEKEGDIFKALRQDLGKHHVEAYRDEVGTLVKSTNFALGCLKQWMATKSVTQVEVNRIAFPCTTELVPEPLGLVLIFSSWNFPFSVSFEPLIGAIAAGNTVVLKPSELSPTCSSLLATTIPMYLDSTSIKVVEGGPNIAERLLEKRWDKIFFTGSPRVGSIVMAAAAKYLTPITLELGGKSPAIIDFPSISKDKKVAIKRIVGGKYGSCAGQACIAIDYVLVEEKFATSLIELIKTTIKKMFGGNPNETNSVARIINKQRFHRLKSILIDDPTVKASIVHGGSFDEEKLFIEPTILLDPPLTSEIMAEEIFGPILPIITLKKIEDSIEFINSRPKPLALYVFTNNETLRKRVTSETSSGSLMFNDAIIQYACDTIPFGGVGQSGFGNYHGKFSFNTFSHQKPVVRRVLYGEFLFRFPPWSEHKLELLRSAYRADYLGLLLTILRLKKS